MPTILISKMKKEDLTGVYEVEKTAFPIPWPIEYFEKELSNLLASYYVAKVGDTIVGYIGMWFVMDECHIMNVAVHEDYRKQGIATQLVAKLFDDCKKNHVKYIMLEVRITNFAAQKLYQKFGFQEEVIRKKYYRNPDNTFEDAIVMSREL